MALKILGGKFKGLSLNLPPDSITRPTSNLLKRKLFDSIPDYEEVIFCDLFAGSGAIGLEAFSRGAKELHLIEASASAFRELKKNSEKMAAEEIFLYQQKASQWLVSFKKKYLSFTQELKGQVIMYLDPPYEKHQEYVDVLDLLQGWYQGHLWIESEIHKGLDLKAFKKFEEYRYEEARSLFTHGDSFILCLKFP